MKTVSSTLALLAVVLVVLQCCTPIVNAWRPQGRFGKRRLADSDVPQQMAAGAPVTNALDALASGEKQTAPKTLPTLPKADGSEGYPVDLDMPIFQHGNVICINKGVKGLFRCVRWVSESD